MGSSPVFKAAPSGYQWVRSKTCEQYGSVASEGLYRAQGHIQADHCRVEGVGEIECRATVQVPLHCIRGHDGNAVPVMTPDRRCPRIIGHLLYGLP
ncbi:hypothetical protein IAG44_40340 [Streptomyces roseirectus]|uniref:Uncharacterized protein n=1 Tax=Streptomyces roseirectus TaxID=2768066 RepID=A0A7H0IQI6_9ACTN|nr:hypothetical protein [Streptomyces roseirectus]QNP75052.1 hypothetical protein IAG44_40340 [Streptomyces roseirectus]